MNRDQLIQRVDQRWRDFSDTYQRLPSDALLRAGVVGEWSVKDLISHIAVWEEESLTALSLIADEKWLPRYARFGGIDAFNQMKWLQFRDSPLPDVLSRSADTHRRLLDYLATAPEHLITGETRFRRRLRLDTYGHSQEHTRQIIAWSMP